VLPRVVPAAALALALVGTLVSAGDEWTPVRAFRLFNKGTWRGLPQSSVTALAQDDHGVLWVGTFDGAATFDGRTLQPVAPASEAPVRGVVNAIAPRRGGGVHVASPAGVHTFDGERWTLRRAARSAARLAVSADGSLWMADVDGAVWTPDTGAGWQRWTEVTEPALDLAVAPDGALWVATPRGALRIRQARVERLGGDAALPGPPAAVLVTRQGRGFLATQAGTLHWTEPGDPAWHTVAIPGWRGDRFRSLAEDGRGRVWASSIDGPVAFGTVEQGFQAWGPANGPFLGGVLCMLADREGHMWFGFNGTGMGQWIGEPWSHRVSQLDPQRPPDRMGTWGLTRTSTGGLLVAGYGLGLVRLEPGRPARRFSDAEGLTEDVRLAVEPEPGRVWVAARFGIYESVHDAAFRWVLKLPAGFVTGIFRSPEGTWYAGTSTAGVYRLAGATWSPAPELSASLDDPYVRTMTWTRDGDLWIGTLRGASVFRGGRLTERLSRAAGGSFPDSVNAVVEARDGHVWVGGIGGVAVRRNGAWQLMTEADGLPGRTVYSMAQAPDDSIWVGGSAGVGRFQGGRWTTWDSRSGLLEDECNLHGLVVDRTGQVFVGTMGSLARFDPGLTPPPTPPLKLTWRERPAGGRLPDRVLRLGWSAAWLGPEEVEYRVRLPRLRDEWSDPTAVDHLDVQNVAAGRWPVEVQARLRGSEAWSEPLRLELEVPALWHETALARTGFVILLGLAVLGAARLRTRQLQRRARHLEGEVRARTAELAERMEELKVSERRAQEASRAKSAFLANMSHELRTPLNGVLGFAQLMARRAGRDAEDRRQLGIILRSGEHLLGLINDVLSLARIEAGGTSLTEARFDPGALVRGVLEMLRPRAESKGLELRAELADGLPREVVGDAGKVRQVLLNLVGNAVKFTERGRVVVRARWADERAVVEVEDTGHGIAADELPQLFEPFVQTAAGREAREGTGLGLALSRELARLMGGDITVASEPGRGSLFRLELALPLPALDTALPSEEQRRVSRVAPGQPDWRVLVVDDVPQNRELLASLLREVGFTVREAGSGEETLEIRRSWRPHLVWLDKRMSGIDGPETVRRIRAEEAGGGERVKVVVHSASALAHEQEEILRSGADDFVAKPFREATIFLKMAEHLGARFEHEEATEPAPLRGRAPSPPGDARARVLVVDDQPINREVARGMLAAMGVEVVEAESGEQALLRLEEGRFDAVLLDVEMPGMGGFATVRAMRERPEWRALPVIAATGHSDEQDRERCLAAGMDAHVGKPLEPDALRAALAPYL
jgi:signal transduction histidine kinase/DNA-binding response OmpR family regulator/ligand-binding sensor domain-containing protein